MMRRNHSTVRSKRQKKHKIKINKHEKKNDEMSPLSFTSSYSSYSHSTGALDKYTVCTLSVACLCSKETVLNNHNYQTVYCSR